MKKKYQVLVLLAVVVILLGITYHHGQRKEERYQVQFMDVFDTVTTITGYAKNEEEFSNQVAKIKEKFQYYNNLYDIYHSYEGISNIRTINENAGKAPVKVEPEMIELLKLGKEMYEITQGQVNIAYGSVLLVWHEYREEGMANPEHGKLPPKELLAECAQHTDINDLMIDEEAGTVYLADPKMSLDVGSIGKGYAVEKIAEYAKTQGMEHLLINAGGNVRGVGGHLDGSPWKIGIQNPNLDSKEDYIEKVQIADMSAVTSGDYQRYYEVEGKKYCHIIDVDTRMPAEYVASVSVVMKDSGEADAMSTALFNMEYEKGAALVESMPQIEAMWILKDGTIKYSSGFSAYLVK
ncbi:MAG: FAD:protein FMN transferase [Lachnospiraceae bacterium]